MQNIPQILIEFDPAKDQLNWEKHGVRFSIAKFVFLDPHRLERPDDSQENPGEDRIQTLGRVGKILFVVYTERGNAIRLISARAANKNERKSYNGYDPCNAKGWRQAD